VCAGSLSCLIHFNKFNFAPFQLFLRTKHNVCSDQSLKQIIQLYKQHMNHFQNCKFCIAVYFCMNLMWVPHCACGGLKITLGGIIFDKSFHYLSDSTNKELPYCTSVIAWLLTFLCVHFVNQRSLQSYICTTSTNKVIGQMVFFF